MKKEIFIECLDNFKKYNDWEHKCYELGIDFWERDEVGRLLDSYIKLLETCCHDTEGDISYYIYEAEYGTKADEYFITLADGEPIKFYTADDLWNYLIRIHPEIKEEESEPEIRKPKVVLNTEELKDIFMENFTKG